MTTAISTDHDVLVLGGGAMGVELAAELTTNRRRVAILGDVAAVRRARERGVTAHESSLASAKSAGAHSAKTVVVATPSDGRNLLLAAAAPRTFGAERVVAFVSDPDRLDAFEEAGIETICVPRLVASMASKRVHVSESTAVDASDAAERVRP